jgi:hypothetical protein
MQQMSFYCRSYCLLNMFRTPLCPSSGAREYYTSGCCLSYLVHTTDSKHLYNTLEFLMMGIMVPETCWASNKICNKKNSSVASSWHFISTYYRRCTVKATSKWNNIYLSWDILKFLPRVFNISIDIRQVSKASVTSRLLWNCTVV